MYERSAIVLERYFEQLFKLDQENNLRENYKSYSEIIKQLKEYQKIIEEEEKVILKFEEVAKKIEEIQKRQAKLHELNIKLEDERNKCFNDLSENPNSLDAKIKKIEDKVQENNNEQKRLHEEYIKLLEIFIERQKERNRYTKERRKVESAHINSVQKLKEMFEKIDKKEALVIKKFITVEKEPHKEQLIDTMLKNGINEKVPFNEQVIQKAVEVRMDIAEKEAEIYISVYEKTKKLLDEIEADSLKLAKAERVLRDTSVKLSLLSAKKDYLVAFLDNERITAMNGKKAHDKIMEDACENFDADITQINNLYELILRETMGKSTKKAYKELYNKTYLKDIQDKEKNFEREATGLRANIGTLVNFNYWRIEGIKNVYSTFKEEVTEKFEKDLSEYQIEEEEEIKQLFNISVDDDEEYDFGDNEYDDDDEETEEYDDDEIAEEETEEYDDDIIEEEEEEEEYEFDDDDDDDDEDYDDEYDDDDYDDYDEEYDEDYENDDLEDDDIIEEEDDEEDYENDSDEEENLDAIMYMNESKEEKVNNVKEETEKYEEVRPSRKSNKKEKVQEEHGIFTKLFRKK